MNVIMTRVMEIEQDLYIDPFPTGAKIAAKRKGINIIIDTFRASNTILALLNFVEEIIPVSTIEEALATNADILIGEVSGEKPKQFHYTNSPVLVEKIGHEIAGKKVVIRTTNGTQGLLNSIGSKEIWVASPRNISAVSALATEYMKNGYKISIIPLGTKRGNKYLRTPEDDVTAELIASKIINANGKQSPFFTKEEKIHAAVFHDENYYIEKTNTIGEDIEYCLQIDKTNRIPMLDQKRKIIRNHSSSRRAS